MSRISTPTVSVNPNLGMTDLQAPSIVYQPEPMDNQALIQYEQLTNILQAGMEAGQALSRGIIMDRKLKAEIAEQSAKLRSDQFRVGLEEAIRLDKSTQVGDRVKYDNVRSYLSQWDYESLGADDQITWQKTLGGYEEKDLEYQREFNSKGLVSVLRTRADIIRGRAEGGDPEAMRLMASIKDDDTALDLLMGLLTPEEQANFRTIDQVNWDLYRDKMSVVLSQFVQEGSKYSAKIAAAANDRKTDMMIEISGDDLADQFVAKDPSTTLPADVLSNINNVRSVLSSINPTITEAQRDAAVGKMLERTAVGLMERGTPEQILKFRQVIASPDVDIDPTTKGVLLNKLEGQAQLRLNNEYESRISRASTDGKIGELYSIREELNAKNPVLTDAQREGLRAKADSQMQSLVTAESKRMIDSRVNEILTEASKKVTISDEDISKADKSMYDMLDPKAFVLENAKDRKGKSIAGVDRSAVLQAIAETNTKLRTMQEQKQSLEDNLTINKMVVDVIKEMSKVQDAVDWAGVQSDFNRIVESRGLPSDSAEYRKAKQELDSGIRNQFFPAMETSYLSALNEFLGAQGLPGDRKSLAPEQGDSPVVMDEKRRLRGLLNYNRLVWDLNGGGGNARSSIINPLVGAFSATATEGPTSYRVRDAFEMYQIALRNGLPMEDIFGRGPDSKKLQNGMLLISNLMASGMSYEDAIRDAGIQLRLDTSGFMFTDIATNPQTSADKVAYGTRFNGDVQSVLGITSSNPVMIDSMPWLQRTYASDYSRALAMTNSPEEALKFSGFQMENNTAVIKIEVDGKTYNSVLPKEMAVYGEETVRFAAKKLSGGRDDVMFVVTDLINGKPVYALRGLPREVTLQTGKDILRTYVETEYVDTKTYRLEDIFTTEVMEAAAPGEIQGTVRAGYERSIKEELAQGQEILNEMSRSSPITGMRMRPSGYLGNLELELRNARPDIDRANRLMSFYNLVQEAAGHRSTRPVNQVDILGQPYSTENLPRATSFNP